MKLKITLVLLLVMISNADKAIDRQEGGYVGSGGQIAVDCVWNFIKHFNYEQYYWSKDFQFTTSNNYRVDQMDFSFYCFLRNTFGNRFGIFKINKRIIY